MDYYPMNFLYTTHIFRYFYKIHSKNLNLDIKVRERENFFQVKKFLMEHTLFHTNNSRKRNCVQMTN